jgi:hypothetical protein
MGAVQQVPGLAAAVAQFFAMPYMLAADRLTATLPARCMAVRLQQVTDDVLQLAKARHFTPALSGAQNVVPIDPCNQHV